MTEKTFTGNRRYPAAFTVTDDPRTHTLALQALIEGMNIGQRRTRDIANSFVRLEELEQIGLIQLNGNSFNVLSVLTDAPSDGSEYVRKDGEWAVSSSSSPSLALDDLTDVVAPAPTINYTLTFNGTNWVPAAPATPSLALDDLTDVRVPSPAANDVLQWNGYEWTNSQAVYLLDDLLDVDAPSPGTGNVLTWSGSEWVASPPTSGDSVSLDSLSDVRVPSPAANDVLQWNGYEWTNSQAIYLLDDLLDVDAPSPSTGQVLTWSGSEWVGSKPVVSVKPTIIRSVTWSRSTAIATPVVDVVLHIPVACTITGWAVYGRGPLSGQDVSGSCQIDIWRSASGAFPPTVANSIVASDKPKITAAKAAASSALTGWTISLNAGDALLFRLDSSSTFAQVFLQLFMQETV